MLNTDIHRVVVAGAGTMGVTLTRPEWYKMYKLAGNMIP